MKPVNSSLLKVGIRLPWSIYSEDGVLLLRQGHMVGSQQMLDLLLEQQLFIHEQAPKPAPARAAVERVPRQHPFDLITQVETVLGRVLRRPPDAHFQDTILRLSGHLQQACTADADAALASIMLESPCKYSIRHMIDTAIVAEMTLHALGISQENRLSTLAAALTANLSMLDLQDELYHRQGPVNGYERREIERHPQESHARLVETGIDDPIWLEAVLHHHETLDGKGYPFGLKAGGIGLASRALNLGDIFCAMVRPRSYRPGMLPRQAMARILQNGRDKHDLEILEYMVRQVGFYPPGTAVELHSGEMAVIVRRNLSLHSPVAAVVINASGQRVSTRIHRDTAMSEYRIKSVAFLRDADFKVSRRQIWSDS